MKRFLAILLCAAMLTVPALAAEPVQPTEVHAQVWDDRVYVERTMVGFWDSDGYRRTPLAYNGTVYIPLRTAGMWMGADVDWVQETMTVALTHNGLEPLYLGPNDADFAKQKTEEMIERDHTEYWTGVDVQLRPDITVTLDGEVQHFTNVLGAPVYPMLFRECIYLPIRSIGELCGKEVIWAPYHNGRWGGAHIYLYDKPTQKQIEEAESYVAQAPALVERLQAGIEALGEETDLTEEEFLQRMTDLKAVAVELTGLQRPTSSPMYIRARSVAGNTDEIIIEHMMTYLDPEHMMKPEYRDRPWQYNKAVFVSGVDIDLNRLVSETAYLEQVYESFRANYASDK